MSEHSPLPWKLDAGEWVIDDADGVSIIDCMASLPVAQHDASLIVESVNAHAALIAENARLKASSDEICVEQCPTLSREIANSSKAYEKVMDERDALIAERDELNAKLKLTTALPTLTEHGTWIGPEGETLALDAEHTEKYIRILKKFFVEIEAERDALKARVKELRETCESASEEVMDFLNVSTPKGRPAEPSLAEAIRQLRSTYLSRENALKSRVEKLEAAIARIADDFIPDNDREALLALDEMRAALKALQPSQP